MKHKLTFLLTAVMLLTGVNLLAQSYTWESVALSNLSSSDVFVIVGNNGSNFAMSNNNGTSSAPSAVAVSVSGNTLTGEIAENIQWTLSGNATDGYTFYPNGSSTTWLYCNNSNNGVRVGTNTNKTFHVDSESNYLVHNSTGRYIGIYSSQDWRCYTTVNNNILNQTFAFYKRVSGSSTTPYIVAEDVEIEYDATSGAIEYTVNNPIEGGIVTASTTSGWLTLGTVGPTLPFSCEANTLATERTASITMTYTYDTDQTVTKNVTVTQHGNTNIINTISEITANGTYVVQGTIVAKSTRGFIVGDGTGYVYYYNQNYSQSSYAIGDMVRLSGSVTTYGSVFEFNDATTVTEATSSNYVAEEPAVITGAEMDARVASNTPTQLSSYVQYVGTLTVSGTYYNITNIEGATTAKGSISFPIDTDFTSLNGQEVVVKGYFVGTSSSTYYNTMIGSVESNVVLEPTVTVSVNELSGFQYIYNAGPSQPNSFTVTGSDLSSNVIVTAPQDFEITRNPNGVYSGSIEITPTDGLVSAAVYVRMKMGLGVGNHTGNISVTCGDLSQSVTLSGTVSEQPMAEVPTFTPAAGSYLVAQYVAISTTTEDATIYYTLDGTDPTESSLVYSGPIEVSATTTIKAMATASSYANSDIATATYTINEPITIADAHALNLDEYGCVEGVVTFIDNRNVYVQDETAGIVLFLNANTVPSDLAIGDMVRAYGKRATYNGLIELSTINGGNANEFTILSNGNTLPLETRTIAAINNDYDDGNLLQSTRVRIENAIIGAINTSANTAIVQDGNSLNIYRIPVVEGLVEGDRVTVIGIIGCYNAPQLRVVNASDVHFAHRPTLFATPTSVSGMTYDYEDGGPSELASFELSGSLLTGPVHIYPSESFEVSTLGGNLFVPENPTSVYGPSNFSELNVYVRMKANLLPGTYTEQIYAVSEDADTLFVAVSGTVTGEGPTPPTPPTPPTEGGYVRINDLSELISGSYVIIAARFDENATNYYAMSNTTSGKPTGVLFTSEMSGDNEVLPAVITNEEGGFYWIVGTTTNGYTFTNANGDLIGYNTSTDFYTGGDNTEWVIQASTAGENAMVAGYEGFYITNYITPNRGFALNNHFNYGAYAVSNNNNPNYNFYLDFFVKTEGIEPSTPVVATPTFTPEAGTYYEEQTVTITCATEGATIHYTIDGTNPTEESPVYGDPLTISETTTVKAIAMKEGYDDSAIAEATYTIQTEVVNIFNQDWEGEMNGWTFVDVEGEMSWIVAAYQGNHYANANGYNHGANEDWCISPAFNLGDYVNPVLTFRTATKFTGPVLEVFFSNDYDGEDPTAATWTALTCQLSTGNYTWVESGDIDLSDFSGDNCYIGFKYTSTDEAAAAWEVDDIVLANQTTEPIVTVTPLTLTGFSYIEGNGPSAEQSFTVSGLNLSANVIVTEASNYEISLASGDDFIAQSTLTLSLDNGTLEETTIYVRLKSDLEVGEYNDENITVSCADVDDIEVTCNGSVTEQPVLGDNYVRISDAGVLVAGNRVILAARYNDTEDAYLAIANTLTGGKPATTEFTSEMDGDDEIVSAAIMADEDSFYWTVGITDDGYTFTNANGDMIGYGNSTSFTMNGDKTDWTIVSGVGDSTALVPEYEGFLIANVTTSNRAFAVRFYNDAYVCGAYSTTNLNNNNAGEYNFFFDIFMQGEGGVPPTPTVASPVFTPAAGTYYETQDVTISSATEGATIYYSLESENGPWEEYETPITVEENMTIWAYAEMEGYNDSPVVSAEYVIQADLVVIFNQDWEEDWHGWTEVCQEGDSLWRIASYQGNHYAYANGYNHPATIDWLISPAFDLDSYSDVVLTFVTAMNYTGPDIEVYFSNDYDGQDPTAATWEPLTCELSTGSWTWTESGEISLDEFSGTNCHIAFKYSCTEEAAAGWEVDDIMLVSGSATPVPTLTATPNTINGLDYLEGEGPSESQSYTLTAANLEGEGNVTVTASEGFEISLDDEEFFTTLEIEYAEGQLVDQPVIVYVRLAEDLEVDSYEGVITHDGGEAYTEVSVAGTVHSENEPYILDYLPLYIQGNNGSNTNRVPVATAVYIFNLEPSTTYRYTNQFVVTDDGPETAGAGNVIYANPEGFYRSTSPSLATEGGYGEFTTDDEGLGFAWFINEPTANARFTPGNHVYLRIRINDGHDGTTVANTFTSEEYATVLNFDAENEEYRGTAFFAKSNEPAMSFAMLLSSEEDERPIYSTSIETTGVDYANINQYADFYKEKVAGKDGWFGGILPNVNEMGVNAIWILDIDSYSINEYYVEDGQWYPEANTINPNGGIEEPIFIDLTDDAVNEAALANVKVWSADHEFVIENGDDANYMMTVYNVLGQSMMTRQINAGSTERISHSLATGVYVISMQNVQNIVSVKVIVR